MTHFWPWLHDSPPPWMSSLAGHDEDRHDEDGDAAPEGPAP